MFLILLMSGRDCFLLGGCLKGQEPTGTLGTEVISLLSSIDEVVADSRTVRALSREFLLEHQCEGINGSLWNLVVKVRKLLEPLTSSTLHCSKCRLLERLR